MPPVAVLDASSSVGEHAMCQEAAMALARALLADAPDDLSLARVEAGVDEHVDLWTPAVHLTSRFDLISALACIDDVITDVAVTFVDAAQSGSAVLLDWLATGRFSRPAFLDDDQLVEPNGAVVRVGGATLVSFTPGERANRIRCYYDRLSIIEQMLALGPGGDRS